MSLPRHFIAALATLTALLIGGCALQPPASETTIAAPRPFATAFELEGRISASDGEQAASGSLLWQRTAEEDRWTLLSPLGQVLAQAVATPHGASLRTADGQFMQAPDLATLLPHVLGISPPTEHLGHWIQAVPTAQARILQLDPQGRPLRIADSGWLIDYAYTGTEADAPPRRIDAHRGETRLRILVDAWTTHD